MSTEVIGEGTYGCVTKPSLKCRDKSIAYNNKVSKIMVKEDALNEYTDMVELSKNKSIYEYIIPKPELCKPMIDDSFHETLKKCENEEFPETKDEDFLILVMEDGGVSLRTLTEKIMHTMTEHDVNVFLSKVHHLMTGLIYFNKKGIVHHDIAPRNVVYNIKTGKIRFIDFGLLQNSRVMIDECRKSINKNAKFWSNFPPENGYANYNKYQNSHLDMDYNLFLERLVYTFDWFSLGYTMQSVLKELYRASKISDHVFQEIYQYFRTLGEENIQKRDYNIDIMTRTYKTLLLKHHIWTDQNPNPSMKSIRLQNRFKNVKSFFPESSLHVATALSIKQSKCKKGFYRNGKTKRCIIRRCRKNYKRNKITQKCEIK
jgi:serine/threonine protein kinase